MKVVLLARDLGAGGAPRQVVTLAQALHGRGVPTAVVACYGGGRLEAELVAGGVPLRVVGKRGRWDVARFLSRLVRVLRSERPDALCCYLVLPNLLGAALAPFLRGAVVAWGLRASDMDFRRYDRLARLTDRLEALLARVPDLVIANSHAGAREAERRGFPRDRLVVVPNGIDVARFRPDPDGGRAVRASWGVPADAPLVGIVARLDPMKDHPTFLDAAALLARDVPGVRFACVGDGEPADRERLVARCRELGLEERTTWAPARADMPAVYSALTVLVSSSRYGEGFSNAVGEAMACARPCVVTDVGDSARVVADAGVVVGPGDPPALAQAVRGLLAEPGRAAAVGARARERVVAEFTVERLAERTLAALAAARGRA